MDKCTCRICKLSIKRKEALESDDINIVKEALREFADLFLNADADASYYKCILDGSWPDADKILKISLDKYKNHPNRKKE
jgi:hypothetical protein